MNNLKKALITTATLSITALLSSASAACNGQMIAHSMGKTCVPNDAKRIVVLEWKYAENLLALGIQPVGVADIEGYNKWVDVGIPLGKNVEDVGTRQQPNLEKIRALKPDLIITEKLRAKQIYDQLDNIAPTVVYNSYAGKSQYLTMRSNFLRMGEIINRKKEALDVLRKVDTDLNHIRAEFRRAGRDNETAVTAQAFTYQGNTSMRVFTSNSLISGVLQRIGLNNSWNGNPGEYGFTTLGLEGLATIKADNFLYITQSDDAVFAAPSIQPLWNKLSFVKNGHAYPLNERTWTYGGPLSALKIAREARDAMLK